MFCRAGEVHLRYLAWWNLFTVLTQAKIIVPLLPPVHGPLCGCVICTVCCVSCVRTRMALVKCGVVLDCQIPNSLLMAFVPLQDCGSMAAFFLWYEWCCWLLCCSVTGCYWWGREWKGREGSQQDSSPGKAGAPHAAPSSWGSFPALQPWSSFPYVTVSPWTLLSHLGIDEY